MLLALDSTDSVEGGCTTHALVEVWRRLHRFAAGGPPRLVRLNPNVPYKTRGNGALAIDLGHGRGRRRLAGVASGQELWAHEAIEEPSFAEAEAIFREAVEVVEGLRSPTSNSALALFSRAPPAPVYERAVKAHVAMDALPTLPGSVRTHAWGSGRGLIGAFAAAAWPASVGTFEGIAYRRRSRWGTPRGLDREVGAHLDRAFPSTFDNWDPVHGHLRIAPRSPCPVLAGVRGTDAAVLEPALASVGPEEAESWMVFSSNQATGDHLSDVESVEVPPYASPRITAVVVDEPATRRGGHVALRLDAGGGRVTAWAFEPTKEFRHGVRELQAGDEVVVEAGVHDDPAHWSLEALTLKEAAPRRRLAAALCRRCGARTKSVGVQGSYRCPACGSAAPGRLVTDSSPVLGERRTVPIMVRRHLSRPNGIEPVPLAWP